MILIFILQRKKTHEEKIRDKVYRKKNEKITGLVGELVRGARDIKMLNSENDFLDELNKKIKETNEERYIMNRKTFGYSFKIVFTKDIEKLLLLIMLILQMKYGMIIPAMALVVYNYANSLGSSTNTLDQIFELIRDFNLSSERIKEIMDDNKFKKEKFGTKHLKKVKGNFEFENVSFGYNDKLILKDLSFKIKENETVAFVGKSGAGKTTIFNLLCKMYDINEGTITIDGININDLDKDSIRGNITIISQNPYIFNMSIKDNLRLVKKDLTDKEMIKACEIACLDEFINELPDKYDTIIGEGGVNLSGGQKQRLAIARALVQKTEIILFDEATSALDNITQEKITSALNNMKNEYTILIIAHRLSTIQNADRILYIEDGKIQKEGTHKYLLENCKEYKELYETEIKNN
jgi:ABC-type multidrug transport system fused ATPase/permease subunit